MTGLSTIKRGGLPAEFDPGQSFNKQAQLDAIIELAKKTKNWDALADAIEIKVSDQRDFTEWWDKFTLKGRPRESLTDSVKLFTNEEAEEITGFTPMQVSRLKKKLKNERQYREQLFGAAYRKAFPNDPLITRNTGDTEWQTPSEFIELARNVMGSIDTDPASNPLANETIKAETFYTAEDDGLGKQWPGNVWLNPPYGATEIKAFAEKLVSEFQCGNTTQAIALTNSATDVGWFATLASSASLICFTRGRISFCKPDGERTSPTMGQAFFYFGPRTNQFRNEFSHVGLIVKVAN